MIVQEINLYQDRFKEKRIWLSATQLLVLTGLMIIALAFSSHWYNSQLLLAQQQNSELVNKKEQASIVLEALRSQLNGLMANNQVDNKITKASTEIAVRKRIIELVSSKQFGSGEGFSSYLSGLSEMTVNNVWLTEISLANDYIKLTGSALKAETIPEYFNLFKQRQLFDGKVFEVFQIDRRQEQNWKVDFLIASREVAND